MFHLDENNKVDLVIMLILAGLSFCLCFSISSPSLFITDEWITTNQLNQLFTGSQLIENEGKYGRLFSGELSAYFTTRDNYLAYSLMLPFLAIPSLLIIHTFGDFFRLLFLIGWFVAGTLSLLGCITLSSRFQYKNLEKVFIIFLFLFLGFFLLNLYFYQPFETTWDDSPVESAAIVFTCEILCALIAPMIYTTFRSLLLSRTISILGAMSVISCSSYLFWSGSAKDHILIAFVVACLILTFSINRCSNSLPKTFGVFFIGGLICWARPEYGSIILIGLALWEMVSILTKNTGNFGILNMNNFKRILAGTIGSIAGLLPFFLNNFLITQNPLLPPQYHYVVNSRFVEMASIIQNGGFNNSSIFQDVTSYIFYAIHFFVPNIQTIHVDLYYLLMNPLNGGIGILLMSPIFLPALVYGIKSRDQCSKIFTTEIKKQTYFCFFIIGITIIAYARVMHGSMMSEGSLPDMRYFSPLYIPMGISSVLLFSPLIRKNQKGWLFYSTISLILLSPLMIIISGYIFAGFSILQYRSLMIAIVLMIYLLLMGSAIIKRDIWLSKRIFPIFYGVLISIPVSIQFMMVLFYTHAKMNGYPFWLPTMQYVFTHIFHLIV